MQIGNVLGFAFRKVAAHGLYLAIPRRGKTPQRVIAFVVGAAVLFGWAEWAGAQMSPPTGVGKDLILWAEPLAGEIRLDGILDEPEWQTAEVATDFVQQRPAVGEPSTQRTEARVIYDEDVLHVMGMYDTDPSGILAHQLERNAGLGTDDRFMWTCETEPVPGARCTHRPSHVAYTLPGFGIADFYFDRTRDYAGADHGIRRREKSATCKEKQHPGEWCDPGSCTKDVV